MGNYGDTAHAAIALDSSSSSSASTSVPRDGVDANVLPIGTSPLEFPGAAQPISQNNNGITNALRQELHTPITDPSHLLSKNNFRPEVSPSHETAHVHAIHTQVRVTHSLSLALSLLLSLTLSLSHSLSLSLSHSLTHSLTHTLSHSLNLSLTLSLSHPLTTYTSTHSLR